MDGEPLPIREVLIEPGKTVSTRYNKPDRTVQTWRKIVIFGIMVGRSSFSNNDPVTASPDVNVLSLSKPCRASSIPVSKKLYVKAMELKTSPASRWTKSWAKPT
jgi:hypothetical protein